MMKSYLIALFYSFSSGVLFGGLLLIFGNTFLSLFTNDVLVMQSGMEKLRIMAFSYCLSSFMDCTIAASRGIGKSIVPTIIVMIGSCAFRVLWVYTIFAQFHTIPSLYLFYPCSWTLIAIVEIAYFLYSLRKIKQMMQI